MLLCRGKTSDEPRWRMRRQVSHFECLRKDFGVCHEVNDYDC